MEYGGCLHFELMNNNDGEEYYREYDRNKVDVDSGRSALQFILEKFNFRRIWLPVYNCPLVGKRILEVSNAEIGWYNISGDFLPQLDGLKFVNGDALLYVNYCGVMFSQTIDAVVRLQEKFPIKVIIDNIPAYFSKPRMEVINIYSCRKFLGVPDGGHIIGKEIKHVELPTYSTAKNYFYLIKAVEDGSNAAYGDYQDSEKRFSESTTAYGMPKLTHRVLCSIDCSKIIEKRRKNFETLHSILSYKNQLRIDFQSVTPSVYPYLTTDISLRSNLLEHKIFISRFWKHVLTNEFANDFEKKLAEYLIPLPIDQRYGVEDMHYIGNKILEFERDYK